MFIFEKSMKQRKEKEKGEDRKKESGWEEEREFMVDAKTSSFLIPWSDISQSSKIGPIGGHNYNIIFFQIQFYTP